MIYNIMRSRARREVVDNSKIRGEGIEREIEGERKETKELERVRREKIFKIARERKRRGRETLRVRER